MPSLIPEQRLDKNGKLVTRHVRGSAPASSLTKLPKPELKPSKAKSPSPKTVPNQHKGIEARYADDRLKEVCRRKRGVYDIVRFTCSDAEIYDVYSVVNKVDNAYKLLGSGIKTKEDAISFLSEHGLSDLQADNSGTVDELVRRNLPAIPAMDAVRHYGASMKKSWPNYWDAVEAHSVRALRDGTDIPHLVLTGQVSFSDVRTVGATRIAKAENKFIAVSDQLVAIHKGESSYDAETLGQLIKISEGPMVSIPDPLHMARTYDAEFVLSLSDFASASNLENTLRDKGYSADQKKQIIRLNDELGRRRKPLGFTHLRAVYEAGVDAEAVVDGLDSGMDIPQIIAVHEGIERGLSSGWL